MRKWNAITAMAVLVLFIIHAIAGAMIMTGMMEGGKTFLLILTDIMVALICLHIVFGVIFTGQTMKACKKSGVSYFKNNKLFWTRRISGFVIILFIIFHLMIFAGSDGGVFRLHLFAGAQLITQLLLVASIAVHIITNVRPVLIAFGIRKLKPRAVDILFVLSVILGFIAAAFIIYYLRWNVF